jgi:Tol biopolymer transport system component
MKRSDRTRWILFAILAASLTPAAFRSAQRNESPEVLLQRGIQKEMVDGDLQAAIELFKRVVSASGVKPATAAQALIHLGRTYERLGDSEARKAYESVVRQYSNERDAVNEAEAHLKAMAAPAETPPIFKSLTRISSRGGTPYGFPWSAITADGRYLVSGQYGFTVHDLATGDERGMEGERQDSSDGWVYEGGPVALSADAKQVAYAFEFLNGPDLNLVELRTLPLNGPKGVRPKTLVRNSEIKPIPFGWSPDDKDIFVLVARRDGTNQIGAVSAETGGLRILKSLEWRWPDKLSLSPDGKYIVYDAPVSRDSWNRDLFLLAVDGSKERPIVQDAARDSLPLWTPDGNAIVFVSDRSKEPGLWMLRISDGAPVGIPELLRRNTGTLSPIGFTHDGSLFYRSVNLNFRDTYVAEIDLAAGTVIRQPERLTTGSLRRDTHAQYSPDGTKQVYYSQDTENFPGRYSPTGLLTVVVRSLESGQEQRVQTQFTSAGPPAWFPDGKSVVFVANDTLHRIDLNTGEDLIKTRIETDNRSFIPAVSPDGRRIYYRKHDDVKKGNKQLLMAYEVETKREVELFQGLTRGGELLVSPDGRQMAFPIRIDDQRVKFYVMSLSDESLRELKSPAINGTTNYLSVKWSDDQKDILIQSITNGDLWWMPTDGGEARKVGGGQYPLIYSMHANGRLVLTAPPRTRPAGGPFIDLRDTNQSWIDPDILPNRNRGIFIVQIDPSTSEVRGNVTRVTKALVFAESRPSFSPDGKSIALVRPTPDSKGTNTLDIIVRSLDGPRDKTYAVDSTERSPVWLHDGSAILFGRRQSRVHQLDLNSGELTNIGQQIVAANPSDYTRSGFLLSPDNKTLYFGARPVTSANNNLDRIVAVDLATWKQREIFVIPAPNGIRTELAISPDGRTLAMVAVDSPKKGDSQLIRVGVDGRGYTVLYTASELYYPTWTKDGRAILIGQWGNASLGRILRVPATGGQPEFTGLEVEDHFDLSPDSSRIAFDGGSYRISSR